MFPGARMAVQADVGGQLVGAFQNPELLLGIPLAIAGAVLMSLGAQYQSRGVRKVERISGETGETGLGANQLVRLLRRPSWVAGTLLLGLAIVCQLSALSFAPLIVVQPLGAISLVITTLLNAQITGHTPTRQSLTAIGLCMGGILLFVAVAAVYATERPLHDTELLTVLAVLLVVIIVVGAAWMAMRQRARALFYIIAAGVLYGFVATLAKVAIKRFQAGDVDWTIVLCAVALVAAMLAGAYFVQTAYASGPPDLVIAGLTVIDPIVAVLIGSLVLGEAANVPLWALIVFLVAGATATTGVVLLARHHPQVISESAELDISRGSSDQEGPTAAGPRAGAPSALDDLRAARDPDDLLTRPHPIQPPTGQDDEGTGEPR